MSFKVNLMKNLISACLLMGALACHSAATWAAPAAKSNGPSARAAAKLKTSPRTQWLAHYLPNDRYKIAGNIWKFVSTNLDTYYHLPNSPNMMRQPNDNVIGFASAADAEEAGYKPDPSDGTRQTVIRQLQQNTESAEEEAVANGRGGNGIGGVKSTGIVVLADGVSTMTMPPGWRRIISQKQNGAEQSTFDLMAYPGSESVAIVFTMEFPKINVGAELSSKNVITNARRFGDMVNSNGQISNSGNGTSGDWVSKAKIARTRWGGLTGVAIEPPPELRKLGSTSNMIMVGRGTKLYAFMMIGKGKPPANTTTLLKSFKAR